MLYLIKNFYSWKCKFYNIKVKKAIDRADKADSLLAFYHQFHNKEDDIGDNR
jgi:hypothetical protein